MPPDDSSADSGHESVSPTNGTTQGPNGTSADASNEAAALPKTHRLRTPDEFKRVFDQRVSVSNDQIVIYGAENDLPYCRIGLVVSKKIGVAVVRNRWKRLIREAFRLQQNQLPPGLDLVILPRAGREPDWEKIRDGFVPLANRITTKMKRKRSGKPRGRE